MERFFRGLLTMTVFEIMASSWESVERIYGNQDIGLSEKNDGYFLNDELSIVILRFSLRALGAVLEGGGSQLPPPPHSMCRSMWDDISEEITKFGYSALILLNEFYAENLKQGRGTI